MDDLGPNFDLFFEPVFAPTPDDEDYVDLRMAVEQAEAALRIAWSSTGYSQIDTAWLAAVQAVDDLLNTIDEVRKDFTNDDGIPTIGHAREEGDDE